MSDQYRVDSVVIGAGVVGLAVARALARAGREVVVLEATTEFGSGISARNSEVIHAGLYYPTQSLKARLCLRGKGLLYDFCRRHQVAHRRLGKLLVATQVDELEQLEALARQAAANGVDDLSYLDAKALRAEEPALRGAGALLSPSSGIVDSHGLMRALLGELEDRGGALARDAAVTGGDLSRPGSLEVQVGGAHPTTLHCRELVNCAGLHAQTVARRLADTMPLEVPPHHLAKGHYFALSGRAPFSRLIYPVPEPGGLGVHLTLDLGGQARFGPDVEWVEQEDYGVPPERLPAFVAAIRRYWPELPADRLQPAYAGIRPKLGGPGEPAADFRIQGPESHGVEGWINLYGIESPGLTAALAIAEAVVSGLDNPPGPQRP